MNILLCGDYWRPMTEFLSPMAVMLEGLGFNLCVAPFLNVCVLNLLQRVGDGVCQRWSELGQRCCTRVKQGETKLDHSEDDVRGRPSVCYFSLTPPFLSLLPALFLLPYSHFHFWFQSCFPFHLVPTPLLVVYHVPVGPVAT